MLSVIITITNPPICVDGNLNLTLEKRIKCPVSRSGELGGGSSTQMCFWRKKCLTKTLCVPERRHDEGNRFP